MNLKSLKSKGKTKAALAITIDQTKLREAADRYLNASAVYLALKPLSRFSWENLPELWRTVQSLIETVIASVELAKAELLKGQPTGTRISAALAASTAVDILDNVVTFTGISGRLLEMVDAPFLKLLVNLILGNRHGVNWVAEARVILGLKSA